jgi:acetylornithine deacetylase/succinyl-diaminopimelate desuccinylase-like protein
MDATLLDELVQWLRIPSISTGTGDAADLRRAAEWVLERVRGAGGEGRLVGIGGGNPLAVGELRAQRREAPTVLIYGHYDVQDPGPAQAWISPPFAPQVRDGRLYARGAADDKGNFLPLLHTACELARDGTLPVNVRVLVEGEEEVGGGSVATWIREDRRAPDAAIVFDSDMVDPNTPAVTVGLRGVVMAHVVARTAERNLHSGLYGGSVLNAAHVLLGQLERVLPGPDGRLREELRAGILAPDPAELATWARLPPGERVLAQVSAPPIHPGAGAEYYLRNGGDASLDVNMIETGAPRTIVPPVAEAWLSVRLAPEQDPDQIATVLERLLRVGLPAGAELEFDAPQRARPALFDVRQPALQLAAAALERACGVAPAFVRSGGSIPIVAEMSQRGYPVIVGGFGLAEDAIHAPNESFSLRSLELGQASARELLHALAELPHRSAGR